MNLNEKGMAFLAPFEGRVPPCPPIWLMRQAGRYLPEYREVRRKAGSFWTMCMTPELAVEVTLQPITRFGFDAAIIFSDILVVPYALGQNVTFEEGSGPHLDEFHGAVSLVRDETVWQEKLAPVYQAVAKTRNLLARDKALIGFAGAPWTLAAYMLEGHGTPDQKRARLFAYQHEAEFRGLIARLTDAVAWHLIRQLEAGADAVQIFDSWAGGLPLQSFAEWVLEPTRIIVEKVRKEIPGARIIGFPRATSQAGYEIYAGTGVDAISIDTGTSMKWAALDLSSRVILQGNLDPLALVAGGETLDHAVGALLSETHGTRFIFNLGHGIVPETPPEHVTQLLTLIRAGGAKR
jgi:uroporphyrinogen decarboxylase